MQHRSPGSFRGFAVLTVIVFLTLLDCLSIRAQDLATYGDTSSDPVKTFNDPNTVAATLFAMPGRLDGMLRVGSAAPPLPVCMWINGDYGEQKGRN